MLFLVTGRLFDPPYSRGVTARAERPLNSDPRIDRLIRSHPALSAPLRGLCDLCRGHPTGSIRRSEQRQTSTRSILPRRRRLPHRNHATPPPAAAKVRSLPFWRIFERTRAVAPVLWRPRNVLDCKVSIGRRVWRIRAGSGSLGSPSGFHRSRKLCTTLWGEVEFSLHFPGTTRFVCARQSRLRRRC